MTAGTIRALVLAAASLLVVTEASAAAPLRSAQAAAAPKTGEAPPPPPPQPYKTEILNFDGWSVTCRDFTEGKRKHVCFAALQIAQQKTGQVIFTWTIGTDNTNRLVSTFQMPTGVSIPAGLDLKFTKGSRTVPYATCETNYCTATVAMDPALTREIAGSATVEASLRGSNGNTFRFDIAMKGFDKAFAALK